MQYPNVLGCLCEDLVEVRNVTCDNVPKASNGKVPVESLRVLVGCQGLSLGSDGAWIGDPLELAVVKDANWTIRNNNVVEPPIELALTGVAPVEVLYRFAFESKLKRMIVIARDEKKEGFYSLMKGAPEVLKPLLKNTTVPSNYDKVYRYHMAKQRRLRSNEVHYLDHPQFGIIIEIRPAEAARAL